MKIKRSPLVLVSVLILAGLGYFAYVRFIRPIYTNKTQSIEFSVVDIHEFALGKTEKQSEIHSIELTVSGNIDGIFDLHIANQNGLAHSIAIKGPEIDYIYLNDWYDDSCFILVESRDDAAGKLKIDYRFIGLN